LTKLLSFIATLLLCGCAAQASKPAHAAPTPQAAVPAHAGLYPSTYQVPQSAPTLIRNATVLTGTGTRLEHADVLMVAGKVSAVGTALGAPAGALEIDGTDRWVTPGLIDVHSHLGVYPSPQVDANSDGNEATAPSTANVWAEHSVWPQDPGFRTALAGGITTLQILPGSANLIGGRSVVLKNVPSVTYQGMKFPDAPQGLKMACGENPKRVYGQRGGPSTRMGNMAGYRAAFIAAESYRNKWDKWNKDHQGDPPERNLRNESLAEVLRGNIYVQNHCYRADEMMQMLDLAHEFGFKIRSFHHAVEAYKIADVLAREGTAVSIWADWWGFKEEAMDGIYENAALVQQAGGRVVIHSDDPGGIQRLNQEAAKAMYHGRRAGIPITRDQAVRWFTANPAWVLGVDSIVGTLEPGKMADVVLWSADPLSVYAQAVQVYNDGWLVYDRNDPAHQPKTDFMLGQP